VAEVGAFNPAPGSAIDALAPKANQLIQQVSTARNQTKIEKSSRDFESILLSSWLAQAEQSFASLPGADDEDEDVGKEQYQGVAMQSLGTAMASSGGIGIARMISRQLHKVEDSRAGVTGPGAPS
jgi:Rod binding domain-containing protein